MSAASGNLRSASLLILLLLPSAISRAQAQTLFFQPPSYSSCLGGQQVAADFNQDGKLDLACSDGTVLLGNGDGTFRTGANLGTSGQFIVAADLNGDGKLDLLLAGNFLALYVYLGNGDGTFQPAVGTLIGTAIVTPVVADVNGDGKPDVLGISTNPFVLFEFLGQGNGKFGGAVQIPVGSFNPFGPLISGDFNGDGKADVVVSGSVNGGYGVGVLLGNGDGSFQSPVVTSLTIPPQFGTTGDFNNDGHLDLMIGQSDGITRQTSVLLGNGDGSFHPAPSVIPFEGEIAVADLDGDGQLDWVLGGGVFNLVFLGNGDGTFSAGYTLLGGLKVIADFNNDGKPDIATGNSILLGNGDGTFQANPLAVVGGLNLISGVPGDFNGDGIPDIAVTDGGGLYILLSDGTGKFRLANSYGAGGYGVATADLNGDGKLDLVIIVGGNNGNPWSLGVMLGNGDGSFGSLMTFPQGVQINSFQIAIADFNGDHKPDLAFLSNNELAIFLGNGDGTFASPVNYFAGSAPGSLVVADFNNDGKVDVAVSSSAGFGMLFGNGDGTFQAATFSKEIPGVDAVADLNNDGNVDLISDGGGEVLLGKGDGTFGDALRTGAFRSGHVSVSDVNGDGKLDLVTTYPNNPVEVSLGNGDGTFASPIPVVSLSGNTAFLVAADFTRDGKPDLVVNLNAGVVTFVNVSQPGFTISVSALSPVMVTAGDSAHSTVTVTPTWGFNSSVSFSCSKLPSGSTCSFSPPSVGGASGTSALTIATSASTPVGTYPVNVIGASGSLKQSFFLSLIVTGVSVSSTTLSPSSVSPGGSASSTIVIAPINGFNATVTISCSSITLNGSPATKAPPVCGFNPASVSNGSGSSMLTVSTTPNAASLTPPAMHRSGLFYALWLPIVGVALIGAGFSVGSRRKKFGGGLLVWLVFSGLLFLAACGGSSSGKGGGGGGGGGGTPAGTYTITVKAAAGSIVNTTNLTLTVQ